MKNIQNYELVVLGEILKMIIELSKKVGNICERN